MERQLQFSYLNSFNCQGRQRGVLPLKRRYFAVSGSYSVKTVADRYSMLLINVISMHWWQAFQIYQHDDLERPWTPPKGRFYWIFRNFWMQRTFQHELRRNG